MGSKLLNIYSECQEFLQTYWRSEGLGEKTLSVMGAGIASYYILKQGSRFFNYIKPIPFALPYRYGSNSWAVITGATSPLGKAFALELAKRGFSICMIGRSTEKLEALEKEIKEINNFVGTKVIVTDYKQCLSPMFFTNIMEELKNIDISILVNNASVDFFDYFTESTNQKLQELFCVNIISVAMLTHIVVQKMLQRKLNSAIINLSSCEGVFPSAFSSIYSASKAFVDAFSCQLSNEIGNKVDVLALRPYWIRVDLPPIVKKVFAVSAEKCVKSCLDQLSKGNTSYGHPKHALVGVFREVLPQWIRNMASKVIKPLSIEERRRIEARFEKRRRYI